MNEYQVNDWGLARFTAKKKDWIAPTECHGTIKALENKFVLFEDHHGTLYLIERKDFQFEKGEFKDKSK